jgi:hypothetical protein
MNRSRTIGTALAGFFLQACCVPGLGDGPPTLPHPDGPHDAPLEPSKILPIRERRAILPGTSNIPPPPEAAVFSDQCDDLADGGPLRGRDCVTADIKCGQTIIGHTIGGVDRFDTRFYEKKFCWPATVQHDGGDERVYRLRMPEGEWRAFVYLDTPCADLDLFALKWDGDQCPTEGSLVHQCEANLKRGYGYREKVELVHQGQATWLIVVEGRGEEEGPFALHVQCREGLM